MAEKPEDLNLPNAVIARLAKDAVSVNPKILNSPEQHSHSCYPYQ